jgi:hypothetical protein
MDATISNVASNGGRVLSESDRRDTIVQQAIVAEIPANNYAVFLKKQKKISRVAIPQQNNVFSGAAQQDKMKIRIEFQQTD